MGLVHKKQGRERLMDWIYYTLLIGGVFVAEIYIIKFVIMILIGMADWWEHR